MTRSKRQVLSFLGVLTLSWPTRCAQPASTPDPTHPGWHLVWADEFNRDGLPDPSKWAYDVGGNGWGNRELQYYTDGRRDNARVEQGHLILEARHESWQGSDFTSARLVTRGKGEWSQGRFEIRARMPGGRGTWPAIWMLPAVWDLGDGKWPDNGEIDIVEQVGHEPGLSHASTQSRLNQWPNGTQRTATLQVPDATTAFHTYAMEWESDEIRIYVDDRLYFTSRKNGGDWTSWPFYRRSYLILNVAVGGWGGMKGVDSAAFPQRMEVDYVRVWQRDASEP
jgi:beta-glucanase (GH16 family)